MVYLHSGCSRRWLAANLAALEPALLAESAFAAGLSIIQTVRLVPTMPGRL